MSEQSGELPIIQKTYDLILWCIPHLNKIPRSFKFTLGERLQSGLYYFLEKLILARYSRQRLEILEELNARLDVIRFQIRFLLDFKIFNIARYEYASNMVTEIGKSLGGWIKQEKGRSVK